MHSSTGHLRTSCLTSRPRDCQGSFQWVRFGAGDPMSRAAARMSAQCHLVNAAQAECHSTIGCQPARIRGVTRSTSLCGLWA